MVTVNQNVTSIGTQIIGDVINIGSIGAPASLPEAAAQLEALKAHLNALPTLPAEVKQAAAAELDAAKAATAAAPTPQTKTTVATHLDKAATLLKSAGGFAAEVAGVLGAIIKVAGAVALFVI